MGFRRFRRQGYAIRPDGARDVMCEMDRPTGSGFMPDGSFVVVDAEALKLRKFQDGHLTEYADLTGHAAGYLNDFAVDEAGRIYLGNFGYDYDGGEDAKATSLHRVDPDGSIIEVASGIEFPNGAVIIDGGRTLVVAETWACRLIAFDLNANGMLGNRRVFAELGNRQPDGICSCPDNAIWVGCFNTGEFVLVKDGQITRSIQYPGAAAVSCVLGGDRGDRLFMTVFHGSVEDIAARRPKAAIYFLDLAENDAA